MKCCATHATYLQLRHCHRHIKYSTDLFIALECPEGGNRWHVEMNV